MADQNSPVFGFAFDHAGEERFFDVKASSRAEAEAIFADMVRARCIGQLRRETPAAG